jgi:hypothetical protein
MIIGRQLVDEYYEDERLYSTGDDYLDELLEKAFCEGYEYAQREFGNPANKAAKRAYELSKGRESLKGSVKWNDKIALQTGRYNSTGMNIDLGGTGNINEGSEKVLKKVKTFYPHRETPLYKIGEHRTSRSKLSQILNKKEMMKDLDKNITARGSGVHVGHRRNAVIKADGTWK